MKLTARQLATLLGVEPSTITRRITRGKLSAGRGEGGEYEIDPSEAVRAYPDKLTVDVAGNVVAKPPAQSEATVEATPANGAQQVELAFLRDKLALIETMHETERRLLSERIEELAARAAELRQERDAWRGQAERLLLTDQRQGSNTAEPASASPQKPAEGIRARLARWVAGAG